MFLNYILTPFLGAPKWRAYKVEDVRRVVTGLRVIVRDAANGGVDTSVFMESENQAMESEMEDLCTRVHGKHFKAACVDVLNDYRKVFGAAPRPTGPRVYVLDGGPSGYEAEDALRAKQIAQQKVNADACLESIAALLRRCDKLEVFITG